MMCFFAFINLNPVAFELNDTNDVVVVSFLSYRVAHVIFLVVYIEVLFLPTEKNVKVQLLLSSKPIRLSIMENRQSEPASEDDPKNTRTVEFLT